MIPAVAICICKEITQCRSQLRKSTVFRNTSFRSSFASCTIDRQRAATAAAVRRKFSILAKILFLTLCELKITLRNQHGLKYM